MKKAPEAIKEEASTSGASPSEGFQQIGPTKQNNRIIALGSVLVGVGLFASGRLESAGPGLNQLTTNAVTYEEVGVNNSLTYDDEPHDWMNMILNVGTFFFLALLCFHIGTSSFLDTLVIDLQKSEVFRFRR